MNDLKPIEAQLTFDYTQLDSEMASTLQTHASEIKVYMARTVESILEVGKRLKAAQELLRHNKQGGFEAWLKAEFNWSQRQAYRFIHVHNKFGNLATVARLNIQTKALYALAAPGTPDEVVEEALERAEHGEPITFKSATALIEKAKADSSIKRTIMSVAKNFRDEKREHQKEKRRQHVIDLETSSQQSVTDFRDLKRVYRIVYADPPWWYGNDQTKAMPGSTRPEDHYPAMRTPEICAIPVKRIAIEDAVLFLWTTTAHLQEAFLVIEAWNFQYKTNIVWNKERHNYGPYTSVRHEHLMLATKGSCTPVKSGSEKSVVSLPRTEHSHKPDVFREMIDRMYPEGNRIELFARNQQEGWDIWGNQTSDDHHQEKEEGV